MNDFRYEVCKSQEEDAYGNPETGYWVYAVGRDFDGRPYSRKVGWYATKEEAVLDVKKRGLPFKICKED